MILPFDTVSKLIFSSSFLMVFSMFRSVDLWTIHRCFNSRSFCAGRASSTIFSCSIYDCSLPFMTLLALPPYFLVTAFRYICRCQLPIFCWVPFCSNLRINRCQRTIFLYYGFISAVITNRFCTFRTTGTVRTLAYFTLPLMAAYRTKPPNFLICLFHTISGLRLPFLTGCHSVARIGFIVAKSFNPGNIFLPAQ